MRPRGSAILATVCVFGLFAAGDAAAATTIRVGLQDSKRGMHMTTSRPSAPAGEITFQVVNESKSREHEMVVVKTDARSAAALPYEAGADEVDLSKLQTLGKVEDLEPGQSGTVRVDLRPGNYILLCNEPGHAHQGMWARFTVTGH